MDASPFKEAGIAAARKIWALAEAHHARSPERPRVAAYLAARGIDPARLPGGVLPPMLRELPECPCESGPVGPAMVAPFVDANNALQGVHRTFLHPSEPRKREEAVGAAKMMRGACRGRCARLYTKGYPAGVLVIAEGIETALSVTMATGWVSWTCGSASSYQRLQLPARLFWPARNGGAGVHTVVFAADLNPPRVFEKLGGRALETAEKEVAELRAEFPELAQAEWMRWAELGTGERGAWWAAWELSRSKPWLSVHVRAPGVNTPAVARRDGKYVRAYSADGSRRSADWNDVLVEMGPALLQSAIQAGVDVEAAQAHALATFTGGETPAPGPDRPAPLVNARPGPRAAASPLGGRGAGDGNGAGMGGNGGAAGEGGDDGRTPWRAVTAYASELPVLEPGALERARRYLWTRSRVGGHRRFMLARWGGEWWVWRDGRYVRLPDEQLRAILWDWLNGFAVFKGTGENARLEKMTPNTKNVAEVMQALTVDTSVGDVVQLPVRLPPAIDDAGEPRWGTSSALGAAAGEHESQRGKISYRNGVLDLDVLARTGEVQLEPHSPELFTTVRLPFDLPVEDLRTLLKHGADSDHAAEVFTRLCPKWYGWLADASDGEEAWERQLQEMLGDTISGDRSIEKVYMLVGTQRGGKGIVEDALAAVLGEDQIVSTSFASLTADRFGLYPLLGKPAAVMPDAHLTDFASGPQAVEILKAISGQGRVQVRDLYQPAKTVKLQTRLWIFCNVEPDLRDDSAAFANRLIVLPITKSALGREDPTIKASIPGEAPGIMLWALLGAIRLHRRTPRRIEVCDMGTQVGQEFERDSAPLRAFVADCCVLDGKGQAAAAELYGVYQRWCEEDADRKPFGKPKFFRCLRWQVPGYSVTQPAAKSGLTRQRVIHGVSVRDEALAAYHRAKSTGGDDPRYSG